MKLPILICIPHSSVYVPKKIRQGFLLTSHEIASYSDLYTDEIFNIPNVYKVKCDVSRLVCDPNRAPDDIISEAHLSTDGVVIQIAEDLKQIYKIGRNPTIESVEKRLKKYHDTFHEKIDKMLPKIKFLIDGHSLKSIGPPTKPDAGKKRADIVLGNRSYTTCSREHTFFFKRFFEKHGFSVAINDPYSGKYILGYHCSRKHLPGIQIEINRKRYMDEKSLRKNPKKIRELNALVKEVMEEFYEKFLK